MSVVGVVVPTIGQRPQYIESTLRSIREAGETYVVLVGREDFNGKVFADSGLVDLYLDEDGASLPGKINQGFRALPKEIEYITWVGDDDLLSPNALVKAIEVLEGPEKPVLVFGHCQYIDSEGHNVFVKKTGSWAIPLLKFGPQLIPQPSATFRRDVFEMLGGLSEIFEFAFDLDLFIRLSKNGKMVFIDEITSSHRLHKTSLTHSRRWDSVIEASRARVSNLPKLLTWISFLWEGPVIQATYLSGRFVSSKTFSKNRVVGS
jgi:GT2 family glycosyltransferase